MKKYLFLALMLMFIVSCKQSTEPVVNEAVWHSFDINLDANSFLYDVKSHIYQYEYSFPTRTNRISGLDVDSVYFVSITDNKTYKLSYMAEDSIYWNRIYWSYNNITTFYIFIKVPYNNINFPDYATGEYHFSLKY